MSIRAIIPARSGSERISGKNLEKIEGISLVRQSVLVALKSKYIDITYLDTDSEEICNECSDLEVEIPALRPAQFSTSLTSTFDSTMHFLTKTLKDVDKDDTIVLMQPTCPFRTTLEVEGAIELFESTRKQSPVICVSMPFISPKDLFSFSSDGIISDIDFGKISENESKIVFDTGSVYVTTLELLGKSKKFINSGRTLAIETSQIKGFDIDTPLQLTIARLLVASGDAVLQKFPQ